jgi:hypothetical protein
MAIESTVTMTLADYEGLKKQIADRDARIEKLNSDVDELYKSDQVEVYRKFLAEVLIDPRSRAYIPYNTGQSGQLNSYSYHQTLIAWLAEQAGSFIRLDNSNDLPYLVKLR